MTVSADLARLQEADVALASADGAALPLPLGDLAPVVAGALAGLGRGDWWVPGLRERAGAVLRDVPLARLAHPDAGARPYKVAPASPAADRALWAVGLALAHPEGTTLVHLGIGAAADGAWHEALNLAATLRPSVIFLVAVDALGDGAPLPAQLAATPAALAAAHGIAHTTTPDADPEAVRAAVAAARAARGPHVIAVPLSRSTPPAQ